ncbi:MAG TPA: nuclease-related domain-containing protein [Marmoricola sp.]|nr:nuclease-related domain-containing protein [Marmoricola sp.]
MRGKVREARRHEPGSARGATATGRALAGLPAPWRAIHDVRWPGRLLANIDHVVVGPSGVYVIHAKTWTGEVEVRHGELVLNGRKQESSVLAVEASAIAVAGTADGVDPALVRPVLCLVRGQVVEGTVGDALVCSTRTLAEVLTQRAPVIDAAEIEAIHTRLRAGLPVAASHRADPPAGIRGIWARASRPRGSGARSTDELVRAVRRRQARRRRVKGAVAMVVAVAFVLSAGAVVGAARTGDLRGSVEGFLDRHVTHTVPVGQAAEIAGSSTRPHLRIVAGAPRPVTARPGAGTVAPGSRLWGVPFRVQNLSTGVGLMPPWLSGATVRDDLRTYPVSGHAVREGRLLPTHRPMAAGQTLSGFLVFELPRGRTIEKVQLTVQGTSARWRVVAAEG